VYPQGEVVCKMHRSYGGSSKSSVRMIREEISWKVTCCRPGGHSFSLNTLWKDCKKNNESLFSSADAFFVFSSFFQRRAVCISVVLGFGD